jgi:hypothetical protein
MLGNPEYRQHNASKEFRVSQPLHERPSESSTLSECFVDVPARSSSPPLEWLNECLWKTQHQELEILLHV